VVSKAGGAMPPPLCGGGLANTAATSSLLLLGNAANSIVAVYFTAAPLSLWGLLVFSVAGLWVLSASLLAALAWHHHDWTVWAIADAPEQRALLRRHRGRLTLAQTMVLVSCANAFAAVTQWYATPPSRTPPLVQSVVNSLITIVAAPASTLLLGDRKRYCSWQPALGVALVLLSAAVALLPGVLAAGSAAQFGSGSGAWSIYYAACTVPQAFAICGGQFFMIRSGALQPGATPRDRQLVVARMLFYNQGWVLVLLGVFFWVDLLPWFGSSSSLTDFATGAAFSFQCSLLGPDGVSAAVGDPASCPQSTPIFAAGFLGTYLLLLVCQALLSVESAIFNTMVLFLSTAFVSLFWLLPGVNPNAVNTPAWSVLTSLALALAGVAVWKRWELGCGPAACQFTLRSLAQELEEEDNDGSKGGARKRCRDGASAGGESRGDASDRGDAEPEQGDVGPGSALLR